MTPFLDEIRETLVPPPGARHGPLPPLLVGLTVVTGLVDAFSYLVLGHVFVANMTGNVVFLGFALAGAPGFSIVASAVALASFWCGALAGGRIGAQLHQHRGKHLSSAVSIQAALLAASVALAALSPNPVPARYRYPLIVVLGVAMGIQNATARRLAVPDLTTTVLTLTLVGTAADSSLGGGQGIEGRTALALGGGHVRGRAAGGGVRPPCGHRPASGDRSGRAGGGRRLGRADRRTRRPGVGAPVTAP